MCTYGIERCVCMFTRPYNCVYKDKYMQESGRVFICCEILFIKKNPQLQPKPCFQTMSNPLHHCAGTLKYKSTLHPDRTTTNMAADYSSATPAAQGSELFNDLSEVR